MRKYINVEGQLFISLNEVSAILTNLADNATPGLDADFALRSTADLFRRIAHDAKEEINASNTEN